MNITKLKAGLNKQLQTLYSPKDYKYYSGLEVIEGYSKPSFFTSLELITSYVISKNVSQRSYVFLIDYFQPEKDEVDMLNKLDEIIKKFQAGVKIEDRFIKFENIDSTFIGTNNNVLEIELDFDFYENIPTNEIEEVADNYKFNSHLNSKEDTQQ